MGQEYGFEDRQDDAARIIKVPPQATPRNQFPRSLDNAAKNPSTSGVFRQLQYSKMCDATRLIASVNVDAL